MPRSVVSSVRFCASAWMRWSGLTPISPARLMRAARLRVIQFPIRSVVASSRSLTRISWLAPVCATLSTSRMPAITKKTQSWRTNSGEVAPLDRVVEGLVPGVEPHLHRGGGDDDEHDGAGEEIEPRLPRRAVHRAASTPSWCARSRRRERSGPSAWDHLPGTPRRYPARRRSGTGAGQKTRPSLGTAARTGRRRRARSPRPRRARRRSGRRSQRPAVE